MPRKRTPDQPTTETTTTTTTTAVADPPAPEEAKPATPTFAERIGQKRPSAPDPFGIAADYIAGVKLFESKRDRQMAIKFEEKPSQPVIDKLKEAGYRWNPADRIWAHPVRGDSAMTTRIEAEKLYQELRQMIRAEKGLESGQEVPF